MPLVRTARGGGGGGGSVTWPVSVRRGWLPSLLPAAPTPCTAHTPHTHTHTGHTTIHTHTQRREARVKREERWVVCGERAAGPWQSTPRRAHGGSRPEGRHCTARR
eukprot:2546282-Rhodomonas_salina.1